MEMSWHLSGRWEECSAEVSLEMNETSISLLDRARAGSESESWSNLAAIYSPLLRGWLRRFEVQASDADDLVQEVLLTVSRELPAFQHSGRVGAFRKWLRQILVNRVRAHWREQNRGAIATGRSSVLAELHALEDDVSPLSRIWEVEHDQHVLARLLDLVRPRFQPQTWEAFRRQVIDGEPADSVAS